MVGYMWKPKQKNLPYNYYYGLFEVCFNKMYVKSVNLGFFVKNDDTKIEFYKVECNVCNICIQLQSVLLVKIYD